MFSQSCPERGYQMKIHRNWQFKAQVTGSVQKEPLATRLLTAESAYHREVREANSRLKQLRVLLENFKSALKDLEDSIIRGEHKQVHAMGQFAVKLFVPILVCGVVILAPCVEIFVGGAADPIVLPLGLGEVQPGALLVSVILGLSAVAFSFMATEYDKRLGRVIGFLALLAYIAFAGYSGHLRGLLGTAMEGGINEVFNHGPWVGMLMGTLGPIAECLCSAMVFRGVWQFAHQLRYLQRQVKETEREAYAIETKYGRDLQEDFLHPAVVELDSLVSEYEKDLETRNQIALQALKTVDDGLGHRNPGEVAARPYQTICDTISLQKEKLEATHKVTLGMIQTDFQVRLHAQYRAMPRLSKAYLPNKEREEMLRLYGKHLDEYEEQLAKPFQQHRDATYRQMDQLLSQQVLLTNQVKEFGDAIARLEANRHFLETESKHLRLQMLSKVREALMSDLYSALAPSAKDKTLAHLREAIERSEIPLPSLLESLDIDVRSQLTLVAIEDRLRASLPANSPLQQSLDLTQRALETAREALKALEAYRDSTIIAGQRQLLHLKHEIERELGTFNEKLKQFVEEVHHLQRKVRESGSITAWLSDLLRRPHSLTFSEERVR